MSTDLKMASWVSLSGKTLQKFEKEKVQKPKKVIDIQELKKSQWSDLFENLMRNRLVLGAIRYGLLHDPSKPKYNRVDSIMKRIKKYGETGNKEFLVDVANLCLLEFEECNHPLEHFSAIDDGEHVETI